MLQSIIINTSVVQKFYIIITGYKGNPPKALFFHAGHPNLCTKSTTLAQRLQGWSNILQMLYKYFVLAGYIVIFFYSLTIHKHTIVYICHNTKLSGTSPRY